MTLHSDAREVLDAWRPDDPDQERLRRRFLAHLDERPDGMLRSCRPDHVTASTLVLSPDGEQALLTLHAKAQRWFQFGGHCEETDATLAGAARRELIEESGLAGLDLDPTPIHLDAHPVPFCGGGAGAVHLDVRFLAVAEPGHRAVTRGRHAGQNPAAGDGSAESLSVEWWPVDRLPSEEESLAALVAAGRERLSRRR